MEYLGLGRFVLVACMLLNLSSSQFLNRVRISSRNGHLTFETGTNKKISFVTGGKDGTVELNGVDLLKTVNMAINATDSAKQLQTYSTSTWKKVNDLHEEVYGKRGIYDRIKMLEGGTLIGNSTNVGNDIKVRVRRLTVRLKRLQTNVRNIIKLLFENECKTAPCKNGGTCQDLYNSFYCICPAQWEGPTCELDVNECARFAGTDLGCQNGAVCTNKPGGYDCQCPKGFYGIHCTKRTLDCTVSSEICGHGTCVQQKQGIKCICDQGWTTNNVTPECKVDVNECELKHPQCSINPPVSCVNVPGSFYCGACPQGYSGNGYYCADINECATMNGGCSKSPLVQCINTPGSRMCGQCPPAYLGNGETCTYQGSVCAVNNGGCNPSATCRANPHMGTTYVTCICPSGFTGTGIGPDGCLASNTTILANGCSSNPCVNGTCHSMAFGYYCVCNTNYTGKNCNVPRKDPCKPNPCQNNGTCVVTPFYYYCSCIAPFGGRNCQMQLADSCGGTWRVENGTIKYPTSISSVNQLYIRCTWILETDPTLVLNITFKRFQLKTDHNCASNWLQIHDGRSFSSRSLGRFCGNTLPNNGTIITSENRAYLWLRLMGPIGNYGMELSWSSQKPVCGENINVTSHGNIQSPGSPEKYPNHRDCVWILRAPEGSRIQFHFFFLEIGTAKNCNEDYLEFNELDPPTSIAKFCNSSHPQPLTTTDSSVKIHFHSDASKNYQGFQIAYSVVSGIPGCGGLFMKRNGQISSPVIHADKASSLTCEYRIKLPKEARMKLTFLSLKSSFSSTCKDDSITIYEESSLGAALVGKYCGKTLPAPIETNENEVLVIFNAKSTSSDVGFQLYYETICGGTFLDPSATITPIVFSEKCVYTIVQPPGSVIRLNLLQEDYVKNSTKVVNICNTFEIRDGYDENSTRIESFCEDPSELVVSSYNQLVLLYKNYEGPNLTFNYTALDVGCGGILKDSKGTVASTSINTTTKEFRYCNWVLLAPPEHVIRLSWLQFVVEDSFECMYDYVEIFDNNTIKEFGGSLGKYCGSKVPPMLVSTSNVVTIRYFMDESITLDGIIFSYLFIPQHKVCGGSFFSNVGIIRSPNYPEMYPFNKVCVWIITVKQGQQVRLNVKSFDIEDYQNCVYDYLEVRSGATSSSPLLGKFCGKVIPSVIPAHANQIYVKFRSDLTKNGRGFDILWDATSTGCGGNLYSSRGSITSPYYPEPYNSNAKCVWKIHVNAGSKVKLVFADLDLEEHESCKLDYIDVFDGDDQRALKLGRYCSPNIHPHLIFSNSSALMVKFRSDTSIQGRGFNLQYFAVCNNTLNGFKGVIESNNFPKSFAENTNCHWEIEVLMGNQINVTFSHFELRSHVSSADPCEFAYLSVSYFDPEQDQWMVLNKFCNESMPPDLTIPSNRAKVIFYGDAAYATGKFRLEWFNSGCGGILTHPNGEFTTPNFPLGYPLNTICKWMIQTDYGNSISLKLYDVDFETTSSCTYDFLEIYNGPDMTYPLMHKVCRAEDIQSNLTGTGSVMMVYFHSDSSFTGRGFRAKYTTLPSKCGGHLKSKTGAIHSPNYPKNFEAFDNCDWIIEVPVNFLLNLSITDIDFKYSPNCTTDYIEVYDGSSSLYPSLGKYCNTKTSILSTNNSLFVRMQSSFSAKGFLAKYSLACGSRIETEGSGVLTFSHIDVPEETTNCAFTIISKDPSERVHLTFTRMSKYFECYSNDSELIIYDGQTTNDPEIERFCDTKLPPRITSQGNAVHITTSPAVEFSLAYTVLSSACGGTLTALEGTFTSPNYPNFYSPELECEWNITVSPGNRVSLTFSDFSLLDSQYCNDDYLEIREESYKGKLLGTFCGDNAPVNITHANSLWIFFRSNRREKGETTAKGFVADFQYVFGNDLTGSSGQIASPLYPHMYDKESVINWQIMVRPLHNVFIEFVEFYFDGTDDSCYSTSLTIYDGPDVNQPILGTFCGRFVPKAVTSSSNIVLVVLSCEPYNSGQKFLLNYRELAKPSTKLTPRLPTRGTAPNCGVKEVIDLAKLREYNFSSPGFPGGYGPRLNCEWIFATTPQNHIHLLFHEVSLDSRVSIKFCWTDSIKVYTGIDGTQSWKLINDLCLPNATDVLDLVTTNYMRVIFKSDMLFNGTGFWATVFEVCGGNLTEPNGIIEVDNMTTIGHYVGSSETNCQWTITVKPGRTIELEFLELHLSSDPKGACIDYVLVKNGKDPDSPILGDGKYCGDKKPSKLTSTGKSVNIKYKSVRNKKFKLRYKEVSTKCGGEVRLSDAINSINISSPNFPNIPNPNSECTWIIIAPPSETVSLEFIDRFDLTNERDCNKEYVEIREGATKNSELIGKYCREKPSTVKSTDNIMFVHFFTNVEDPRNGFKATVSLGKCGGTVRGNYGTIKSPNFENRLIFPKNIECVWHVVGPRDHTLSFAFKKMDINHSPNCSLDYVEIFDIDNYNNKNNDMISRRLIGTNITRSLGKICGNNYTNLRSSSNEALVKFVYTGRLESFTGFSLTFNATQDVCGGSLETTSGMIQSPGYPVMNHFQRDCEWKITVPKGRRITFILKDVNFDESIQFHEQVLAFFNGEDVLSPIYQYEFSTKNVTVIKSTDNVATVFFWSHHYSNHRGFVLWFNSNEPTVCVGDFNGNNGTIRQPVENKQFHCSWTRKSHGKQETVALYIEAKFKVNQVTCKKSTSIRISDNEGNTIDRVCSTTQYPKIIRSPYSITRIITNVASYLGPVNFTINYQTHPCGGVVTDGEGYIRSPNYPNKYGKTADCAWIIKLPTEQQINITTRTIDLGSDCSKNYVVLYGGGNSNSPKLGTLCGKKPFNKLLYSNELRIEYHGDAASDGKGFELKYEPYVTVCQSIGGTSERVLQSPLFPHQYPPNIVCSWDLVLENGYHVGFEFERFQMEESENCENDYLQFYDFKDSEWQPLGKFCGRNNPKFVNSTSNQLRVVFRTNDKIGGVGFRATWTVNCGQTAVASKTKNYVVSPGYPGEYANDLVCVYNITSPGYINVEFEEFHIEGSSMCKYDNMSIRTFPERFSQAANRKVYCGTTLPPPARSKSYILLTFKTDPWIKDKGFKFSYMSDECGGAIDGKEVSINSPTVKGEDGRSTYVRALSCMWNITAPKDKVVVLTLTSFEMESHFHCEFDNLEIYSDFSLDPTSRLAKLCGNLTMQSPVIQSPSGKMLVKMKTDLSNHFKGFQGYVTYSYGPSIGCGGNLNMSESETRILRIQPGYSFLNCHWEIFVPQDFIVRIEVEKFSPPPCPPKYNSTCSCYKLQIKDGVSSLAETMETFCEPLSEKRSFLTSDRFGWVDFQLLTVSTFEDMLRIKVSARPSICGKKYLTVSKDAQILTSPNYPMAYPERIKCSWTVKSWPKRMYLKFLDFDLDTNDNDASTCTGNRLEIRDKHATSNNNNALGPATIFKGSMARYGQRFVHISSMLSGVPQLCGSFNTSFDYYPLGMESIMTFYTTSQAQGRGFRMMYKFAGCNQNYTSLQGMILDRNQQGPCHMTIDVPKNMTISIYFLTFSFADSQNCDNSGMEIIDLQTNISLARLCGRTLPNPVFSFQNSVSIRTWLTRSSYVYYDLIYTTTSEGRGCGGSIFNHFGRFSSPLYPASYQKFSTCTWQIRAPAGLQIALTFLAFTMPNSCETDYVLVTTYSGDAENKHKLCGDMVVAPLRSNNRLTVEYVTSTTNAGSWLAYFVGLDANSKFIV